jgi:hypothetical protein
MSFEFINQPVATVFSYVFTAIPPPPPAAGEPWPDALSCPILSSLSEQRQRNVGSFNPDVGPPKMRRRSTAVGVLTSMAFRWTDAQVAIFDEFYINTLADGTLPFSMNHPRTTTSYSWMFVPDESPTLERFAPGVCRVSIKIIRLP